MTANFSKARLKSLQFFCVQISAPVFYSYALIYFRLIFKPFLKQFYLKLGMTKNILLKSSVDNVSEIVDKTKVLVDRVRCAIIHQDNLTKDCFDTNATELSKTVESIKRSYLKLEEEYQNVKAEIKAGEKRLNDISDEYKKMFEENTRLKDVENGFLNSKIVADEHEKIAKELREILQIFKLLTGVRFDFNLSEKILTGYVAICGNKPSNSTIIPFEIDAENSNEKKFLWHKINEACMEISE